MSFEIPKSEQASGISISEPPAMPLAPQAAIADTKQSKSAVPKSMLMPRVLAAASESTAIVIAAPAIFTVAPSGMLTEYSFSSISSFSARAIFTGIFAADERVKNAVIALFLIQVKISG